MDRVEVKALSIYAKHGCHAEERRSGGPFEVDILVQGEFSDAIEGDDIQKAVDYVALMDLATEIMSVPKNLIETVAKEIAEEVLKRFTQVDHVDVTIRKMKPPVDHDIQFVSASTSLERTEN